MNYAYCNKSDNKLITLESVKRSSYNTLLLFEVETSQIINPVINQYTYNSGTQSFDVTGSTINEENVNDCQASYAELMIENGFDTEVLDLTSIGDIDTHVDTLIGSFTSLTTTERTKLANLIKAIGLYWSSV